MTASEERIGIRQDRIKQYPNIQIYKNDCLFQSFCCTLEVLLLYMRSATQLTFICSESTIGILEKGVKYVQS